MSPFATDTQLPVLDLTQDRDVPRKVTWPAFDLCQPISKHRWPFQRLDFLCSGFSSRNVWLLHSRLELEPTRGWPSVSMRTGLLWSIYIFCCGGIRGPIKWNLIVFKGLPLVGPMFQHWVPKPGTPAETPPNMGLPAAVFCSSFLLPECPGVWVKEKRHISLRSQNLHFFPDHGSPSADSHSTSPR